MTTPNRTNHKHQIKNKTKRCRSGNSAPLFYSPKKSVGAAKRPRRTRKTQRKLPLRRPLPRKQPHPRGKLRHSPSPTLRLPRRRRAPRRLRLNRPLPQQPKRGPIRLPARKAPLKNRLRRRATPPTEPTYRYDARRNLHEYDMVKPFHQSRARQGAGGAGFRRTA